MKIWDAMLSRIKSYSNLYPILGLLIFLYICIISNNVLLADDLSKLYEGIHNKDNYGSFLGSFMSGTNMTSRPISAFFTGSIIYLLKYNPLYYYLAFIFFLLSLFWVKALSYQFFKNEYLAIAATFLYATIPIGTSTVFSPIMLNSALATIFFCSSVIIFMKKKKVYIFLSAVLFVFSFLSYEIFAPCILIFLFLSDKPKNIFFHFIISIGLIIFYKKVIEPSVFESFYQRERLQEVLNINRAYSNIILIGKLIFRDLPLTFYKSLISLKYFDMLDWSAFFLFNLSSLLILKKLKFETNFKQNKITKFLIFIFLFSFMIFFMSNYKPTLFGFDNRNLGGVKLFFILTIVSIIITIASKTNENVTKYALTTLTILFSITIITTKNAWLYASKFNRDLFSEVKQAIIKEDALKADTIYIKYDVFKKLKHDPQLLLREQIFFYNWESPLLKEENGLEKVNIYLFYENNIPKKSYYIYDYDKKILILK